VGKSAGANNNTYLAGTTLHDVAVTLLGSTCVGGLARNGLFEREGGARHVCRVFLYRAQGFTEHIINQ